MPEGTPEGEGISVSAFVNRLRRQYEKWEERFQKLENLSSEDALVVAAAMLQGIESAEREDANRRTALIGQYTKEEREELTQIRQRTIFLKQRLNTLKTELERII